MIIVIADDLTGATEIGGIGLRYQLKVEIANQLNSPVARGTDLFIVNADTRSMPFEAAMEHLRKLLNWVRQLRYAYIFKKVDSVLRGHVLAEINMQLTATQTKRALLLPANPRLGRTIYSGNYYIHGKLIHETDFARDPEFPVTNAKVLHMLHAKGDVSVQTWKHSFPQEGIVLGEAKTEADMEAWMRKMPEGTTLAGGSSSFHAFLQHVLKRKPISAQPVEQSFAGFKKPFLYVCGSNFEASVTRIKEWDAAAKPVFYIPLQQVDEATFEKWINHWIKDVTSAISVHKNAIIAFDNQSPAKEVDAAYLRLMMAKTIKILLKQVTIEELVVEGGATAGAILEQLQISKLTPLEELAPGVIRCSMKRDPKIWITLKPGSYNWCIAVA